MKYLIVAAEYGNGHLAVSQAIIDQLSSDDQYELIVPANIGKQSLESKFSVYIYIIMLLVNIQKRELLNQDLIHYIIAVLNTNYYIMLQKALDENN